MITKVNVYNQKGEAVGEMILSDKVFAVVANISLIHQAMVTQTANQRQILAHTKDRSEVRGGGRKPWRQKGTGRARAGSTRSPIWIGGGVTFGPRKDRNYSKKINKKMKQKAILAVLSDRVKNGNFAVIDKLEMKEFKTKAFNEMLRAIEKNALKIKTPTKNNKDEKKKQTKKQKRSTLIINDKKEEKVKYSGRNLAGVEIINLNNINIVDLLKYQNIILTKAGIKKLEEQYSKNV